MAFTRTAGKQLHAVSLGRHSGGPRRRLRIDAAPRNGEGAGLHAEGQPGEDTKLVFGILPIALSIGSSGGSRQSLGIAVVGGVIFSGLLTLFVVPAFYLVCDKAEQKGSFTAILDALKAKLSHFLQKKSS